MALSNPIDGADFDEPIYVDELWLEQSFLRDRGRFRLGFLEPRRSREVPTWIPVVEDVPG